MPPKSLSVRSLQLTRLLGNDQHGEKGNLGAFLLMSPCLADSHRKSTALTRSTRADNIGLRYRQSMSPCPISLEIFS